MFLELDVARVHCQSCGTIRRVNVPFADERRVYTRAFARFVLELRRCMTITDVAEHLGVSWWMVKDIEQRHLQKHYARPRLKQLRRIAIDRWNVAQLATQLDGDGFEIVAFGQGYPSIKHHRRRNSKK